jgi:hypothetical protein
VSKIVSTIKKTSSIFLIVILISGFIGLTYPVSSYGKTYQSAICDDINLNINGIDQKQTQRQTENNNFETTTNDQVIPEEQALNALTDSIGNGNVEDPLLTLDRNIVNVCFNENDNFMDAELSGTQEQEQTGQPPSNNIYVVWREFVTPDNAEIFFAASYDNGKTFSTPINISNTPENSFNPQITSERNNVYVVWTEEITVDNNEIFFTASNNNGQTFSDPPDNLSNTRGSSFDPKISSEGNNVYVVWTEETTLSNNEIFFTASNNNGQTFTDPPDNLSNSLLNSRDPQISNRGNNVYVVWTEVVTLAQNSEIFFRASNNNGDTFSTPPDNLSQKSGFSQNPQIANEANNVYVVWEDDTSGNDEIIFSESDDNGDNFDMPDNISNNAEDSRIPQISSEANNVYVVWQDDATPDNDVDIFFTASNNNGQTFSDPPDNLSNTRGSSFDPKISSEGNNVYVVWEENLENVAVFYIASDDNGNTFPTSSVNLSNKEGGSLNPQISSEGNNVYVVWDDNTPGPSEILFKLSDNSGDDFGQDDNLSMSPVDSAFPQISSNTS